LKFIKKIVQKILRILGYKLQAIHPIPGQRVPDKIITFKNFASLTKAYEQFLNDSDNVIAPNVIRPYLLSRLTGTLTSEAYFIIHSLAKCKNLNGSVCEFGVGGGETSVLIANEILNSDKVLHLFDSFEGLPSPTEKDQLKDDIFSLGSMEAYKGTMAAPEELVQNLLSKISFTSDRYYIHKGWIEKVLKVDTNLPKKVSFAYVDFDFYEPIKLALEFLHYTTLKGAIIIVDDYDYFSTGSKLAVDEFLNKKNSNRKQYNSFIPDVNYGHFIILTRL